MDADERDIRTKAVAERVTGKTMELLEAVARWVLSVRDRAKRWLWFLCFAILVMAASAYARLSLGWVLLGLVASSFLFEWWMRRTARKEWQRYHFASEHFRVLLECRKTLQSMTKEERGEVRPEVVKWFLGMFLPGGIEKTVLWENVEEGVLFRATRRMKLESMGLSGARDNFPNDKTVEYAWTEYAKIDPDRKWIAKLRERGGYEISSEKLREAVNRQSAVWTPK
jgi:hypothetical protein